MVASSLLVLLVLAVAGMAPALAMVGRSWVVAPFSVLVGSIIAASSATAVVLLGGGLLEWFWSLAAALAVALAVARYARSGARPTRPPASVPDRRLIWMVGIIGALAIISATAWGLMDLRSATTGFDARAVWILRSGWLLEPHHELLVNLRSRYVGLGQTAYPPLVSAVGALAWGVTGQHSERLATVAIALVNSCALIMATSVFVVTAQRWVAGAPVTEEVVTVRGTPAGWLQRNRVAPSGLLGVAAALVAGLVVVTAFGVTEPFMTNGYADPAWSLAAVGALTWGLQAESRPSWRMVALALAVMAGMTKDEGVFNAIALVVLIVARPLAGIWWNGSGQAGPGRRLHDGVRPLVEGAVALALIAAWPVAIRIVHARGQSAPLTFVDLWSRTIQSAQGLEPYLHGLVWAAGASLIGWLALRPVRRRLRLANDAWGWTGTVAGCVIFTLLFATGGGAVGPHLLSAGHRVSEFVDLAPWWILGMWAIAAVAALVEGSLERGSTSTCGVPVGQNGRDHDGPDD